MSRLTRLLLIVGITLHLTWYILLWTQLINHPQYLKQSDFATFYITGQIAQRKGYDSIYNLELERAATEELSGYPVHIGDYLTFNHPPLLAPILEAIVDSDYFASFQRWGGVLFLFQAASIYLLTRLLQGRGWELKVIGVIVIGSLLFYPTFISILKGQDATFVLLGATLWLFGLLRESEPVAGLGLSMTVMRPHIALILAIPFLFKRRRIWWWFCAGALGLVAYSYLLVGTKGFADYLKLLFFSTRGEGFGLNEFAMINFAGALLRIFPGLSIAFVHTLSWGLYFAVITWLCYLWKISPSLHPRHFGLAVILSTFAAPHLHYHDLSLLSLPLLLFMLITVEAGHANPKEVMYFPLVVSTILLFGDLVPIIRFIVPYILMLVLALGLWFPQILIRLQPIKQENNHEILS